MGEKKVVTILYASPRRGGNTDTLAEAFASGAADAGCEVRRVYLSGMNLKGCLDCRRCWSAGAPCVQRDDMEKVYPYIESADVVALAVPLYFFSWPAQIKPVFDRLLPFCGANAPRKVKGKKSVILAAAGDAEDSVFDGLRSSFRIMSDYLKWEVAGEVYAYGIYTRGEMEEKGEKWLEAAKALGKSL